MERTRRVQRYLTLRRLLPGRTHGLLGSLTLRRLTDAELEQVTRCSYDGEVAGGFASAEFNLGGFSPYEVEVAERLIPSQARVLVVGCAGGREVIGLARAGHEVTGVDCTPSLVETAGRLCREAGIEAAVLRAPPSRLPDGLGTFDAVWIGRGVLHHVPGRSKRVALLRSCVRHLGARAPLFIRGVFHGAESERSRGERLGDVIARALPSRRARETGDRLGYAFNHHFSIDGLRHEATQAGLEMIAWRPAPEGPGLIDVECRVRP